MSIIRSGLYGGYPFLMWEENRILVFVLPSSKDLKNAAAVIDMHTLWNGST